MKQCSQYTTTAVLLKKKIIIIKKGKEINTTKIEFTTFSRASSLWTTIFVCLIQWQKMKTGSFPRSMFLVLLQQAILKSLNLSS